MLNIVLDSVEIAISRRGYAGLGLLSGARTERRTGWLHATIKDAADSFWEKQLGSVEGKYLIVDGRPDTLIRQVFAATGGHGAILAGMRLDQALPCHDDPESYVVEIFDGPPDNRHFEDLTMLAVYRHDTRTLTILWIGAAEDLPVVRARLENATQGLRAWAGVLSRRAPGWCLR